MLHALGPTFVAQGEQSGEDRYPTMQYDAAADARHYERFSSILQPQVKRRGFGVRS